MKALWPLSCYWYWGWHPGQPPDLEIYDPLFGPSQKDSTRLIIVPTSFNHHNHQQQQRKNGLLVSATPSAPPFGNMISVTKDWMFLSRVVNISEWHFLGNRPSLKDGQQKTVRLAFQCPFPWPSTKVLHVSSFKHTPQLLHAILNLLCSLTDSYAL